MIHLNLPNNEYDWMKLALVLTLMFCAILSHNPINAATQAEKAEFEQCIFPIMERASELWDIPFQLMASQAILESDWGTSYNARHRNNLFGITINNEYKIFESIENCIEYYVGMMYRMYFDCLGLAIDDSADCLHYRRYRYAATDDDLDDKYAIKLKEIIRGL